MNRSKRGHASGSNSISLGVVFLGGFAMVDPDESSPEEFAETVGTAILLWQSVEAQAAHLFAHLLASRSAGAMSVFYHIKNFSTRLEMMNIGARFLFYGRGRKRLAKQWAALASRLYEASSLRNRIAHFEIDESITATGWKFTLGPPAFDWSQLTPDDPQRWKNRQSRRVVTFSQIEKGCEEFRRLAADLSALAQRVIDLNGSKVPAQLGVKALPHAQVLGSGRLVLRGHLPPGAEPRPQRMIRLKLRRKKP
jgi:hypothetical protein